MLIILLYKADYIIHAVKKYTFSIGNLKELVIGYSLGGHQRQFGRLQKHKEDIQKVGEHCFFFFFQSNQATFVTMAQKDA